jgi:hypothetical protein
MMKQYWQRVFLILAATGLVACSTTNLPHLGGMLGSEGGNAIHVIESATPSPQGTLLNSAAEIKITRYTDTRPAISPNVIGKGGENVFGLSGKDIVLDQDVATMVTHAMKVRLLSAGFQVDGMKDSHPQFELSGVVRDLTCNVKARDEISIAIETTLKEVSTGKVVWSGVVEEKNSRYAGISGDNKTDIAKYLNKELGIVVNKTTEAISDTIRAAHPELFNLPPGVKPVSGVTVLVAPLPPAVKLPAPIIPVQPAAPVSVATEAAVLAPVKLPQTTATSGWLLINTVPPRAKVYLDSIYYGLSPLRLEIEPGVRSVIVKSEGYKTITEKVSVRKGDSTEMELKLDRGE